MPDAAHTPPDGSDGGESTGPPGGGEAWVAAASPTGGAVAPTSVAAGEAAAALAAAVAADTVRHGRREAKWGTWSFVPDPHDSTVPDHADWARGTLTYTSGPSTGDVYVGEVEAGGGGGLRGGLYTRADGTVFAGFDRIGLGGLLFGGGTVTTPYGDSFTCRPGGRFGRPVDRARSRYAARPWYKRLWLPLSAVMSISDVALDVAVVLSLAEGGDTGWAALSGVIVGLNWGAGSVMTAAGGTGVTGLACSLLGLGPLWEVAHIVALRKPPPGSTIRNTRSNVGTQHLTQLKQEEALGEAVPQILLQVFIGAVRGFDRLLVGSVLTSMAAVVAGLATADLEGLRGAGVKRCDAAVMVLGGGSSGSFRGAGAAAGVVVPALPPWTRFVPPPVAAVVYRTAELGARVGALTAVAVFVGPWLMFALLAVEYAVVWGVSIRRVAQDDEGLEGKGMASVGALALVFGLRIYSPFLWAAFPAKWRRGDVTTDFFVRDADTLTASTAVAKVSTEIVALLALVFALARAVDTTPGVAAAAYGSGTNLMGVLAPGTAMPYREVLRALVALVVLVPVKHALYIVYHARLTLAVGRARAWLGVASLKALARAKRARAVDAGRVGGPSAQGRPAQPQGGARM